MKKVVCVFILLSSVFIASCTSAEKREGICRIENVTLIDAEKDQPIKDFDPIPQNAVIKLSDLPTNQLSLRINLSSPDCASKTASGFINDKGIGGMYIDDKPPFAYFPDRFSLINFFGYYDYIGSGFFTRERDLARFKAEIRDKSSQVVNNSQYRLDFILEE